MRDSVESLLRDMDEVRERTPLPKGAKRKKVNFPKEIRARAAALWEKSGESSDEFAGRLGVSPSIVRAWGRKKFPSPFLPVAVQEAIPKAPAAKAPAVKATPGTAVVAPTLARANGLVLVWREVRLDVPRDLDPRQLAELVKELKGGASC